MIRAAVFCKRDIRSFRVYVDIWELFRDLCHQRGIPASSYLEALMIRELDAMASGVRHGVLKARIEVHDGLLPVRPS